MSIHRLSIPVVLAASLGLALPRPSLAAQTLEPPEPSPSEAEEDTGEAYAPFEPIRTARERRGYETDLDVPINLSGYFWADTGFRMTENAQAGQYDQDAAYMQGRFVLGADYLRDFGGVFALARAELIGFVNEYTKAQFEAHVLDAYLMVGGERWDFQIGRFLPWKVYDRGPGIELYTPEEAGAPGGPPLYWSNIIGQTYFNEPGQAAVHLYPFDALDLEIAGVYGQFQQQNYLGVRPAAVLDLGPFELKGTYEYLKQSPQSENSQVEQTSEGFGGNLTYANGFMTAAVSAARKSVRRTNIRGDLDGEDTADVTSLGGFVELRVLTRNYVAVGYHLTTEENLQGETVPHHVAYASLMRELPIEGLSVKAVYGYALAEIEDVDVNQSWNNEMNSLRVRLMYVFH